LPDYVGIEKRETFDQLHDALGDDPVDIPMRVKYGSYPRYRLLVTYFIEHVGYQNFNTQIRDLRTQLRLAHEEIGKLEETIRRLQAPSLKTRPTRQGGGRATRKIESTYSTQTNGRHLPE